MRSMSDHELRTSTDEALGRVSRGEVIEITVEGRAVARMSPVDLRPRWVSREDFITWFETGAADPTLTDDLRLLAADRPDAIDS
jgi:antitoxin (DNA-binding transcriptional repressor) of toxin-antitoxin stability system